MKGRDPNALWWCCCGVQQFPVAACPPGEAQGPQGLSHISLRPSSRWEHRMCPDRLFLRQEMPGFWGMDV